MRQPEPTRRAPAPMPAVVPVLSPVLALALALGAAQPCRAASAQPAAGSSQPAVAASQAPASQAPRVRIEQVRSLRLQGRQAQVDLVLRVSNPGGWSLSLDDIRFHCSFNGTATAQGRSTGQLDLPPHGSAEVPVRVDIDGQALLAVLATLPPDGLVNYQLVGSAEIAHTLLRLPFREQGSVVLRLP